MKNTKILKRGNNQTQREPRTIKQRRGTRGSGCCTLDLFKVLCKRNCRTSCHIFKRLRIESNWKRGRKVKLLGGNAIVLLSIIVENDFVPHFIVPQCELFLFTFWSRWRGKYTWHDSRDSFIVYILYYIYTKREDRDKISLWKFQFLISTNVSVQFYFRSWTRVVPRYQAQKCSWYLRDALRQVLKTGLSPSFSLYLLHLPLCNPRHA